MLKIFFNPTQLRQAFFLFFALILSFKSSYSQQLKSCAFNEALEKALLDSNYLISYEKLPKSELDHFEKSETVFIIPTVVHVLYNDAATNISEAQINSQMQALNRDFRKRNADTTIVDNDFSAADIKIEFCLAKRDPQGNITTGINRVATTFSTVGNNNQYYQIQPAWNPDKYLNIWVGRYGGDVLGKATPPGTAGRNQDGVMVDYEAFGTVGTVVSPYNLGRTTTHEVGHWLNLLHIWGTNDVQPNCGSDDLVEDTPDQEVVYTSCPSGPKSSCNSKDNLANYMGYVNDACMGNFTDGQKLRMRTALVLSRGKILLSNGCLEVGLSENSLAQKISIFPNPAKDIITLKNDYKLKIESIRILDRQGKVILSPKLPSYNSEQLVTIDGIAPGFYLVQIDVEGTTLYKKLIIQQ